MKQLTIVLICALFASSGWASAERPYDYPFVNSYEATVLGTPEMYMAPVPAKVSAKEFKLKVFEDRETPDVFWYLDKLRCSLAYQDKKAPLVFNIAGTGAAYDSGKMLYMQRVLYAAGFHVISLSSPTHPEFIVAASESMVPGHILEDSRDLYRVMELAWQKVGKDIEVSEFYLTGYSLGAAQAGFVSYIDEDRKVFDFQKVFMINPPLSLFSSVSILDDLLLQGIPGGPDNAGVFMGNFFRRLGDYYHHQTKRVDITDPDFLYDIYKYHPLKESTLEGLIGMSFRLSSSGMIFTTDVMTDGGYIVPEGARLTTGTSLTDFLIVANHTGFTDYFHEFFYPYFKRENPGLTKQELIERVSLESI